LLYLVDASGRIRYTHVGEGRYRTPEAAIRALLAGSGRTEPNRVVEGQTGAPSAKWLR
jgi:hypothetical protein